MIEDVIKEIKEAEARAQEIIMLMQKQKRWL